MIPIEDWIIIALVFVAIYFVWIKARPTAQSGVGPNYIGSMTGGT